MKEVNLIISDSDTMQYSSSIGFAVVDELLALPDFTKNQFTLAELQAVVANNEKQVRLLP